MSKTRIVAVVVTYNGEAWIGDCLSSLTASSLPMEIVVVDNASTDKTLPLVRATFPAVEVIALPTNVGFGKANNLALSRLMARDVQYVLLVNQDVVIERDTVGALVSAHQASTGYGIVSPIHLNGKGDGMDLAFSSYLGPERVPGFMSDAYLGVLKPLYDAEYANAAAWLLPRHTIEVVGGFDPLYAHYGEDDDYICRLHRKGLNVGLVPHARIRHNRPQALRSRSVELTQSQLHAKALTFLKCSSISTPSLHYILRCLTVSLLRFAIQDAFRNRRVQNDIQIMWRALLLRKQTHRHRVCEDSVLAYLNTQDS